MIGRGDTAWVEGLGIVILLDYDPNRYKWMVFAVDSDMIEWVHEDLITILTIQIGLGLNRVCFN